MRRVAWAVLVLAALVAAAGLLAWRMPADGDRAFLPFAADRACVIAVTDDTDFFQFESTAPVYALLDSLGLRVTKTVWAFDHEDHPPERAGLSHEDPDYLEWVLGEFGRGHEVVLHSATAGHDERDVTMAAHDRLEELIGGPSSMVIFHSTNREAFYWGSERLPAAPLRFLYRLRTGGHEYEGDDAGSPYYWVDVSRDLVRYVRGYTTNDINTLLLNPSMPYEDPSTPGAPLWCASSNGRLGREFVDLLSPRNIDRLTRENGVSIVYTHFARGFTERDGIGSWRVRPEVRETLVRCASSPWVEFAPAGAVLDRLRVIQLLEDALADGVRPGEQAVLMIPEELVHAVDDISVVPGRLPEPLALARHMPLREWLDHADWRIEPGDAGVFDGARQLPLRERWRLVLRWLSASLRKPSYSYESSGAQ